MPPKKATGGKKEDGKVDEGAIEALQAKIMEKDLEIETLTDKIMRLEKRSQHLASHNESQRAEAIENEEKLRDVIACLTSGLKEKDTKSKELEILLETTKAESEQSVEALTKELNELKSNHKFIVNDLRLQLDNAEVQLRGIDHFNQRRESIEQENVGFQDGNVAGNGPELFLDAFLEGFCGTCAGHTGLWGLCGRWKCRFQDGNVAGNGPELFLDTFAL